MRIVRRIGLALGGIFVLLLLVLVIQGFRSVALEEAVSAENYGAGSVAVEPSFSGLEREFPSLNAMAGHEATPESVELGRLLFFDSLLSANNDIACASCHHPDKGFSDGLAKARGAEGKALARNSMSLWNVGFTRNLFWDGRAGTLEEQAQVPLTHLDEMAVADTSELEAEVAAIDGYRERFETVFTDGVSFDNITIALADFQRSLISRSSPFDTYAAGDFSALSASQRRGLTLFRSAATRCFECHENPTFASETFRKIGIPDSTDQGAGDGRFKVPTLRNVALSSPYMHNGSLASLEEVIDFYAKGGGRPHEVEGVDPFVLGFELSPQERTDLVNFLYALTDESGLRDFPAGVPSGLPVVARHNNPAREEAQAKNVVASAVLSEAREPRVIRVQAGETIQAAVDRARPGDTVEIPYGLYYERVVIDISDFTLLGLPNDDGDYPVLDGQGELSEAVIASGNNFRVGFLRVQNYRNNGVLVEGVNGVHMHDLIAENTGIYGLYPTKSTDVLVEDSIVSGASDAGIYAGQSVQVIIRNNKVFDNVLGIEVENTVTAEVYNNHAHDNTLGILVVVLPNLASKVSLDTRVYNNLLAHNNTENFAQAGTAAALVPPGTGIVILGSDDVEVTGNTIRDNRSAGVGVFALSFAFDESEIDVPGTPERIHVFDNAYANNGNDPHAMLVDFGIPGVDLLWDVSGAEVYFDEQNVTKFPPVLPSSRWTGFVYNMYWQSLNWVLGIVG